MPKNVVVVVAPVGLITFLVVCIVVKHSSLHMALAGSFKVDASCMEGKIFCVTAPDLINVVIDG